MQVAVAVAAVAAAKKMKNTRRSTTEMFHLTRILRPLDQIDGDVVYHVFGIKFIIGDISET